jgi:hypothetical protein
MDKTLETASTLASQLFTGVESIANKYGPTVVDTVLWVTRVEAINRLISGVLAVIVMVVVFKLWLKLWKWASTADQDDMDVGICQFLGTIISIVIGIVGVVVICCTLLNVWVYIALVKPELYIAKQTIDKVISISKKD